MALANFNNFGINKLINYSNKKSIVFTLPQGWGFFTKNPQSLSANCYLIEGNKLERKTVSNSSWKNLFGLARKSRYYGFELSQILNVIPANQWINSKGNFREIDFINHPTFVIKNEDLNLLVYEYSKKYLIVLNKPIPFAWAQMNQEEYQPFKYIVIELFKES
ncbi:MAG: SdpA family antimicrobial peptide system protein [Ekhidna sp.]|nr:SdpA family antimicrobial peptide system protein [Ekhidna sp.]